MLDKIFSTVMGDKVTPGVFFACTAVSVALGLLLAFSYMYKNRYTKSFVITLALLPAIVQVVMMLVNGNLGTGVAVMGAFSLIRFRSAPGSAREILSIFLAMAIGLATGVGYLGIAVIFTVILILLNLIYTVSRFGEAPAVRRRLKITVPESLDYTEVFDDAFAEFTASHDLTKVKTTNMGSLYQLTYDIDLKDAKREKEFLDNLRCRNGNLDIVCSHGVQADDEL